MRGSAGGLEKLSAGVSGLVKKRLDCIVYIKTNSVPKTNHLTMLDGFPSNPLVHKLQCLQEHICKQQQLYEPR